MTYLLRESEMNEEIKQRLQKKEIWLGGFYILFFMFTYGLSNFVLFMIVFFQYVALIVTGKTNLLLLEFSQGLSTYAHQILVFLTFNSDQRPFPFSPWPSGTEFVDKDS